ncbi:MAG TPA: nucleoside-diphosphate kinase [Planctomycetaceae bacterium]|nr:nucleoside-diphosphate kinase [Planctomycetaceae bacterium]HIQ19637.1 nucleoside-diphosphate kinase [Planctomycetota bacterium]
MVRKELEQTLVLIKPDALKISLTGYILSQFSEFHTGLRFAGAKIVHVTRMLAEEHYAEHAGEPFYPSLIEYMTGRVHYPDGPHKRRVIALVFCGPDAVPKLRRIAGPTNPHDARDQAPGTIRALGTVVPVKDAEGNVVSVRLDNLVHASATREEAEREIKLWFKPSDIMPYMRAYATQVSPTDYYYKDGQLLLRRQPGSRRLIAEGDTAWQSDLEALALLAEGKPAPCTLNAVAAKYLINEVTEDD